MSQAVLVLAAIALVPAMTGPVASGEREMIVALCSGGSLSVPLDRAPAPGESDAPCCAKGCHSGQSRKRSGRAA